MSANGQVVAPSPVDQLRERLEDPAVAAALNSLLDHADLLAILVTGLDGFMRRGDEISESLASAVGEVRAASESELGAVDLKATATSLISLATAMVGATPALTKILHSPLIDPQAVDVLAVMGQALAEGMSETTAEPGGPLGLRGLWKVTKDKDVNRGLGFLIRVARAFGRRLPQ